MTLKIVLGILIAAVIFILIFAIKTKKPFRVLFWSGSGGILCCLLFTVSEYFFDIGIKFNLFSLLSSFILGIPGVITMLITNVIWNI